MTMDELTNQGKYKPFESLSAGIGYKLGEMRKENIRESFSGACDSEHRMEICGRVSDVTFINDSKATNINAAWYALECIDGPVVWIAGGVDKGNDYSQLFDVVNEKVVALICLGKIKYNQKLISEFTGKIKIILEAVSMPHAIQLARQCAVKNDTILLSPACSSFDLFENYEDRGQKFKAAVKAL